MTNFLPGTNARRCPGQGWPRTKTESDADFTARLKRAAKGLPQTFIDKALGSMKRRCQSVINNKGDWVTDD